MKKKQILLFCLISEILIIVSIAVACIFSGFLFAIFYNVIYGLTISLILPLIFLLKEKQNFTTVGIKKVGVRQIIVLAAFVLFSIGGQIVPKIALGEYIEWNVLPVAILPLIMTTFFEEFLFRGFIQIRLEKHLGFIPAIIISGLLFSLYHLGYPGFRTLDDLILLFAVGLGFAIAFKLSGNNLIVSFFVNLPNAFVTYIFKHQSFPTMTAENSIYAAITIVLIFIILYYFKKQLKIKWIEKD